MALKCTHDGVESLWALSVPSADGVEPDVDLLWQHGDGVGRNGAEKSKIRRWNETSFFANGANAKANAVREGVKIVPALGAGEAESCASLHV